MFLVYLKIKIEIYNNNNNNKRIILFSNILSIFYDYWANVILGRRCRRNWIFYHVGWAWWENTIFRFLFLNSCFLLTNLNVSFHKSTTFCVFLKYIFLYNNFIELQFLIYFIYKIYISKSKPSGNFENRLTTFVFS